MTKILLFVLVFSFKFSFANSSATLIEISDDSNAFNFISEGAEGSATSGIRFLASNPLCKSSSPAHGYPVPIPEPRSKLVGFKFSKKSLMASSNSSGGFCRYSPQSAIVYLTLANSEGWRPLIAQLEIYNSTEKREVAIFCKIILEHGVEALRCRNADEAYPHAASRIALNLSEGTSTIIIHQE